MICGKGGSGKSALTVLMAKILSKNYKVYVVDSDESNALLPQMLNVKPPRPLVEYLGGKKTIFKKGEVNIVKALAEAGKGIKMSDLSNEYISSSTENIKLVTIGKVREFGEGCACPFNFLTRVFLKNLVLDRDEIVLVDTDAGVEHLGRGVEEGCDIILTVADPTAESLMLAKILSDETAKLGKRFLLLINKVTPSIAEMIREKAKDMELEIAGMVRFDEEVFKSCLEGSPLKAREALIDVENIVRKIV